MQTPEQSASLFMIQYFSEDISEVLGVPHEVQLNHFNPGLDGGANFFESFLDVSACDLIGTSLQLHYLCN